MRSKHPGFELTIDDDGWSEWPLWVLMSELGQYCQLGEEPPFNTEILIGFMEIE